MSCNANRERLVNAIPGHHRPSGRAIAGLLTVFAEFERENLRERVRAGIAQARKQGKPHGRPRPAAQKQEQVKILFAEGVSKAEIARRLVGQTSVRRLLTVG
jgi:DNA invertase Pin-like site-specific DNA recombinase